MNYGKLMINKFFCALIVSGVATFSAIAMDKKPMVLRSEDTFMIKKSRSTNLDNAEQVGQSNITPLGKIVKDDRSKSDLTVVPYRLPSNIKQQNAFCSNGSDNFVGLNSAPEKFKPRKLLETTVIDSKKELRKQQYQAKKRRQGEREREILADLMAERKKTINIADEYPLAAFFSYEITPDKPRRAKSLPPKLDPKRPGVPYSLSSPSGYDSDVIDQQPREITPVPFSLETILELSDEDCFGAENTQNDYEFGDLLIFDKYEEMFANKKPLTRQDNGWTPQAKKTFAEANAGLTIVSSHGRSGVPQQLGRLIEKNDELKNLNNS